MDEEEITAARARERRVRRLWISGILAVVLVAGGAVAVGRSAWWDCRTGAQAGGGSLDYSLAADSPPKGLSAQADDIEKTPGVGDLLGSATLENDALLVPTAGGDFLISDAPYYAERNTFHDARLDPRTGEVAWSRGQAGQAEPPRIAGDDVLSIAAIAEGPYRISILDADDGSMQGCLDVDRFENSGIGQASAAVSPDGAQVALTTPTSVGSVATAFTIDGRKTLWETPAPRINGDATWVGDTVVLDRYDALDVNASGNALRAAETVEERASLTGLDATSGKIAWRWPGDLSGDPLPESGSTVPFVDGPEDLVVVSATTVDDDDHAERLVGVDAATGTERWSTDFDYALEAQGFGDTVLALSGDVLTALDAATGQPRWSEPVQGGASGPRPAYAQPWGEDQVVVTTGDGITIIDLRAGTLTDIPVPYDGALQLIPTDTALAVVADDVSTRQVLVFARQG